MARYVIIKPMRWYHRLWHHIITLFGKEAYAFELIESRDWVFELDRLWLCPGCWEYRSWDFGCADDAPELCDECWDKRREQSAEQADDRSA